MANRRLTERLIDTLKPGKSVREVRRHGTPRFRASASCRPDASGISFTPRTTGSACGRPSAMPTRCNYPKPGVLPDRVWQHSGRAYLFRAAEVSAEAPFEDVAEVVFRRYARNWKPGTLRGQSRVPEEPDPSPFQGTADRRHHEQGCPAMVRLPPVHARRRRPGGAGPVGDHVGSGNSWLSSGGQQSVPEHSAVPEAWPRTVPVA